MRQKARKAWTAVAIITAATVVIAGEIVSPNLFQNTTPNKAHAAFAADGMNYQICDQNAAQYLTSPWTYHALASGSQSYTVAQYQALPGYGTTLPPLPSYIAGEPSSTEAAVIYAPGSSASVPQYNFPESPIIHFFEGGAFGAINLQTVSGDEFIGGSATGFPEPTFDNNNGIGGLSASNDSYAYPNSTTVISHVTGATAQGASTVTLGASTIPILPWGAYVIGTNTYTPSAVSGSQSGGYTLTIPSGLDVAVAANASVYYAAPAGDVTVSYLDISHDLHNTTGTIYTGSGWTVTHNNIHDGYSTPGNGVAVFGGDQGIVEYNCFSKMGDYAINVFGTNNKFDYNEVFETNFEQDPGCGCSGGGKWWGTLNADIVDNAFVKDGPGEQSAVWMDNGNTGTLLSGNYFNGSPGTAFESETGYNIDIENNLFINNGWGSGSGGCGTNCNGAINLNSSGGVNVPGSRYENQIIISNNQFANNWEPISIWQAGGRSCENSGEGNPDAAYCSGGYPISSSTPANGQYYFSHNGDKSHQFWGTLSQAVSPGSTTIQVPGALAINDQVGFGDPVQTTSSSSTNVSTLTGSQSINVTSTTGFPASGMLRVGTSAAWSDGGSSFTGAILSYTGTTATGFTGVSLVRGSGTLAGPVLQVQPYKVTAETCYANDCVATVTPAISGSFASGTEVSNAGTCQLFATSAATPTNPMAPNGVSYFDGCQWETKGIAVSNNTFKFQPSQMAASAPLVGGGTTTTCTNANANSCGTFFDAFQESGQPPFSSMVGGNQMFSNSNFTGCPIWDPGCTSNPLKNINALSNPPGATANNGAAPFNSLWASNAYIGPQKWNNVYQYGNCTFAVSDSSTGKSQPASNCSNLTFSQWQSDWYQDAGSSYTPLAVTLTGLSTNQVIYGANQAIGAYADTDPSHSISSTSLLVNGTTAASDTSAPYNFSLNTTTYNDGNYTIQINGADNGSNSGSDSTSVYITNGDLNHDGQVNLSDLILMSQHYGVAGSFTYEQGNITGATSGTEVGLSDLIVLSKNYGYNDGLGH